MHEKHLDRRAFLGVAASFALGAGAMAAPRPDQLPALPVFQVATATADLGYHAAGPEHGRPVVLLLDQDDDIERVATVARILAVRGMRVLVPLLRGDGRAIQLLGFINALHMPEAVFAGMGAGAQTARDFAALKPTRCVGLGAHAGPAREAPPAFADAITELVLRAKWRTGALTTLREAS